MRAVCLFCCVSLCRLQTRGTMSFQCHNVNRTIFPEDNGQFSVYKLHFIFFSARQPTEYETKVGVLWTFLSISAETRPNPATESDQTSDSAFAWQRADGRKHAEGEEIRQRRSPGSAPLAGKQRNAACVQLKAPSLHLPSVYTVQRPWQMPGTQSVKCHVSAYAFSAALLAPHA